MYGVAIEGLRCEYGSTTCSPNSSDSTPPYLGDFRGLLPPHEHYSHLVSDDGGELESLVMITGAGKAVAGRGGSPLTLVTSWQSSIVPATNALLLDTDGWAQTT